MRGRGFRLEELNLRTFPVLGLVFTVATHLKSIVKMSVPTLPNCITTLEGSDSVTIWKFFTEAWETIRIIIIE